MKTYKIGELANLLNMTTHGLRYYEKEELVVPDRINGIRVYSHEDRLWLEFLIHMKSTGMHIRDLKEYVQNRKSEQPDRERLIELLENHKRKVEADIKTYQSNLELVNKKINLYKSELSENEGVDLFNEFKKSRKLDEDLK